MNETQPIPVFDHTAWLRGTDSVLQESLRNALRWGAYQVVGKDRDGTIVVYPRRMVRMSREANRKRSAGS